MPPSCKHHPWITTTPNRLLKQTNTAASFQGNKVLPKLLFHVYKWVKHTETNFGIFTNCFVMIHLVKVSLFRYSRFVLNWGYILQLHIPGIFVHHFFPVGAMDIEIVILKIYIWYDKLQKFKVLVIVHWIKGRQIVPGLWKIVNVIFAQNLQNDCIHT